VLAEPLLGLSLGRTSNVSMVIAAAVGQQGNEGISFARSCRIRRYHARVLLPNILAYNDFSVLFSLPLMLRKVLLRPIQLAPTELAD
jgi:hypothetical protein